MEASCKENASENTGQHYDGLFEHCLTTSDVGDLNNLVVTPNKDAAKYFHLATVGGTNSLLQLEDEEGKSWRFSYLNDKQSFVLTTGWSNYVKEKQLSVGDFVFFQRHLTDSTRLFIGYRRCDDGAAAPGDSDCLLPHPTSSETLVLTEKLKEVETPPRQSITRSEPVLVISCCNSQDSEETYFISYIFKELRLRGFTPLRYDLTRSTVPGNSEMLYSPHVGIMVISMNYACSRECLDGVVAIMDHLKANDLMLIPVFFKVNPSDVRNQSGPFERALVELWNSLQEPQVQRWREAMTRLTFINGFQYMKGGEVMLAKNIVRDAYLLLSAETNRNLKGMGSHLKSIGSLLHCAQSSSPHIVGLWGMAGIGKTTISKEILRKRAKKYNVCYFLSDFHLMCQTKGLGHLRDEFFSKIFGEEMVFIDACDIKLSFLRDRLQDKRVLIVLDGVSNARDVEVLVGGFGWFSGRHTIIVTSTDRQVLVQCNAKEIYEIPNLSESQSIWLCSHYATEQNWKGQRSLILKLVKYASGNPLALRVLGLSIQKQCIDVEKHLRRLRQHPPIEFQDAFRRSFYKQSDNEKNIFLDLACFFRGENKDHVLNILDGCGFLSDLGIYGLIDESLISLVCNRIEMPNIFQDMGRFVVCQEHVEAGKRSRLWDPNDIIDVLTNNSGTEANEGIYLDAAGLTFELSPTVFERMYRLRLFKLHCPSSEEHWQIYLPQGLYSLPDELRLLHWERYPLESLPQKFSPKNLVELNMPYSNITKLWKGTKNLEKLKRIILSHSRQFTELPKLSKARNLEHIDLEGCTSLVEVNSSILHHQKLTFLSLKDCSHLRIMPTTVHLESLEVLNLSGCSELEDLHDFSPNLKELYLAGTAIGEVPSSLADLTKLVSLDLENCKNLQYLPPGISSLKAMVTLKLFGCSNLKSHQTLDALLVTFDLESGNRLEHLPPIAVVTHSAKHPASSMNLSTMVDMAAPYKRKRSKRVIKTGILSLRKRDPERTVSSSTNLSEVLLASASTSVNDCSYTSFYGFHVLPERPDQPECQYYMKTGDCKDGNVCKFHHPKDRKLQTPDLHLPGLSLSLGASSSSKLVKASTEKLKQHKNTSSMVSHGNSSFVSDTAQTTFGRDTIDLGEEMSATIIDGAAIRIQTYFRSYMCRRQHLITRQGIVLIQAHWRGYRVRKNCRNSNLSMELVK